MMEAAWLVVSSRCRSNGSQKRRDDMKQQWGGSTAMEDAIGRAGTVSGQAHRDKVWSGSKDLDEGWQWREGRQLAAATHARTMTRAVDQ